MPRNLKCHYEKGNLHFIERAGHPGKKRQIHNHRGELRVSLRLMVSIPPVESG